MPYKPAQNAVFCLNLEFLKIWNFAIFEKFENICIFIFFVCFELYIDVLSVSMRFGVIFCIYMNIFKHTLLEFRNLFLCTKKVLNCFPPHPYPRRQQKSPARGQENRKTHFWLFPWFLWKIKKHPARGIKKGSPRKKTPPFSRGGPKRGNPTMTTSTITARRKGDPQHYVEGKKESNRMHCS